MPGSEREKIGGGKDVECFGLITSSTEDKLTRPVGNQSMESIWKGIEGDGENARDLNHITQHQVRAAGGLEVALCALQKGGIGIRVL